MSVRRRLALALIRLHPPAWRRRYADEVSTLVEQSPASMSSVIDLTRSGAGEWIRAAWRGVVIEPGRWPHPTRLAGLWVITVLALSVGASIAAIVEISYYLGVLLSYGMVDRAQEVLAGETNLWRRGGAPPLTIAAIVDVFVRTLLWFGLPAIPAIVLGRATQLGRRFPTATRVAVAVSFSALPIWLMPGRLVAGSLLAGWVLASAFFPRRPSAEPGAASPPMVHA